MTAQYKHKFIRKIVTHGPPMILIDRAKEWKDKKTGVFYWKLLKAKHVISRPPSEALHTTEKGHYSVVAYYLGDINYKYAVEEWGEKFTKDLEKIKADFVNDLKVEVKDIVKMKLAETKSKGFFNLLFMKPTPAYAYVKSKKVQLEDDETITTNQRLLVHDQIKKAVMRKHKGIAEYVPLIAGIGALVILIAVVFIFGGELIAPMVELNQQNAAVTQQIAGVVAQLDSTAKILASVIQERQYVMADSGGTVALLNKTAPN